METFKIADSVVGQRIDIFTASKYKDFSRSSLEQLFETGQVRVNSRRVKAGYKLKAEDVVVVETSLLKATPPEINLPIIYQDDNVIVINKPAGVLTHSKGSINSESTVASFVKPMIRGFTDSNNRAGIVHRLDRLTSGLIIAAKTPAALKSLQKQFSTHRVLKIYLAIVKGHPDQEKAVIDIPIIRNSKKPTLFRAGEEGKKAVTNYEVIENFMKGKKNYSLLKLQPQTGRTHQLRVHLAEIGHPIVGDVFYKGEAADRLYLHATKLELVLPSSKKKIFQVPAPKEFEDFING